MNREIKFRAWDKKEKYIADVYEIDFCNENVILLDYGAIDEFETHSRNFDEIELLQHTGLKDRNGKEIYEGDIIRKFNYLGEECSINKIVWDSTLCTGCHTEMIKDFISPKGYGREEVSIGLSVRECEYIEVIGNIYENPELLERNE